mmetsp:Transcript_87739/g.263829  ORF Transcript_87739/g.263829 Transcript_87739/m.263829 type:complete len:122 (+) Transcript_87739:4589-4954(+)
MRLCRADDRRPAIQQQLGIWRERYSRDTGIVWQGEHTHPPPPPPSLLSILRQAFQHKHTGHGGCPETRLAASGAKDGSTRVRQRSGVARQLQCTTAIASPQAIPLGATMQAIAVEQLRVTH